MPEPESTDADYRIEPTSPSDEATAEDATQQAAPGTESNVAPDGTTTDESTTAEQPTGTDKALRDTQAALTKERNARREVELEKARLEGMHYAQSQMPPVQQGPSQEEMDASDWQEIQELMENDPAEATKRMQHRESRMRSDVQNMLTQQSIALQQELEARDPKTQQYEAELTRMRENPYFAALPVSEQVRQVETWREISGVGPKQPAAMTSPGSPAGTERQSGRAPAKAQTSEAKWAAYLDASGANRVQRDETQITMEVE